MVSNRYLGEDTHKSKEQLLSELAVLRQQVAALKQVDLIEQQQFHPKQTDKNKWRIALLQELTASLASAFTTGEIFQVLLHQSLVALSATRGWVAQRNADSDQIEIVRMIGDPAPDAEPQVQIYQSRLAADVIRTGKIVIVRSRQDCGQQYPDLVEQWSHTGEQSLIALPLMFGRRVIGSIGWSFAFPQEFNEADCSFMMTLARQGAQALERATLYEAERLAREIAEAANRVKDEFLTVLSHELRSPLNPILGWTKMLRSRQFNPQMTDRALEAIERNAKLQIQLIEDLLDVSHILQGKLQLNISTVNLVSVIKTVLETSQLAAESKSITLQFSADLGQETSSLSGRNHLANANVRVAGDPARLRQIVWNLVSNAVKFTPDGGQVNVGLSLVGSSGEAATLEAGNSESVASYVQLSVSDTGRGIEPAFLPYIFEYFRQGDSTITRQFGGLGLGLTIVRHLVELHGGNITAESEGEGQGTTFCVVLPLLKSPNYDASTPMKANLKANFRPLSGSFVKLLNGVRVLVVDDNADMREYVNFVLHEAGARVVLARSVGEALAKLSRFKPDVLISDLTMPNVDGYQLLKQVRSLVPELGGQVPAIALTDYAGEYNQQQILAAGFQLHVAKPVEPDDLIVAIAKLLTSCTPILNSQPNQELNPDEPEQLSQA